MKWKKPNTKATFCMIRKHANPQRQKADEWSPGERDMGVTRSDYYQDCGFLGSVKKMSGI